MANLDRLTRRDREVVSNFTNFLSWGQAPGIPNTDQRFKAHIPPAVWAYLWGLTLNCPPEGEM